MRRLGLWLALWLLSLPLAAQESRFSELGSMLEEYVRTLERETPAVRHAECDFLIGSTPDSLTRQFIALKLYDCFLHSHVMGTEETAIYLIDTYFTPGRIQMESDLALFNAEIFADFNRSSLLGCQGPALTLEDRYAAPYRLTPGEGDGRYSVLYFYDTGCASCLVESPRLARLLRDYPQLAVYPIYTGSDYDAWTGYVARYFPEDRYRHLWDPSLASDFQRLYGVLSTPKLFLLSPEGVILGRGLDSEALATLLAVYLPREEDADCPC